MISRLFCLFVGICFVFPTSPSLGAPREANRHPSVSAHASAQPMRFEANRGQTDSRVDFVARGAGYTVFLTPTESVTTFAADRSVVRVALAGSNAEARVSGEQELAGRSVYMTGKDRLDAPAYERVRYSSVYPGVDLVYYGDGQGALEYDFVVAPGADPSRVAFRVDGATDVKIAADGDLVIASASGELRHRRPVLYQTIDGLRRDVSGEFELRNDGTVGFRVGAYDASRTLTIDPVLSYATYYAGSGDDNVRATAVDANGATFLVGYTSSIDFPSTTPVFGAKKAGNDMFVVKLAPNGKTVEYAFYLGGSGDDRAESMRLMPNGRLLVAGSTTSFDFPTINAAQGSYAGGARDAIVLVIDPQTASLVFSTYFGGTGVDSAEQVDFDAAGNVYVVGDTTSANLPVVNPLQGTLDGPSDGFVVKYAPAGGVSYATYFGGSGDDYPKGIRVSANGAAFVGLYTNSSDLPTIDAIDPSFNGGQSDAYVAKLAPSGTSIVYSTYLGGAEADQLDAIAIDPLGALYVLSTTRSLNFPTVGALQPAIGGSSDFAVTKISPDGSTLLYSSFLGGTFEEVGSTIAVNALGAAIVGGYTVSADFPAVNSIQSAPQGFRAQIVAARVSPRGDRIEYATFVGGNGDDLARGGSLDAAGNFCLSALTNSSNFPTSFEFQSQEAGAVDAGLVKIADRYTIAWSAPLAAGQAPVAVAAVLQETGDSTPFGVPSPASAAPAGLVGYRVYRSLTPIVPISLDNIVDDLSVNNTTALAPGGSYYVVTALYSNGTESGPSQVVAAGIGKGATLKRVNVRPAKIVAKGSGFTFEVQVFLDGIPFVTPARIVDGVNGVKVVQTGTLRTGETIAEYLAAHGNRAIVAVRNSDGGVSTSVYGL